MRPADGLVEYAARGMPQVEVGRRTGAPLFLPPDAASAAELLAWCSAEGVHVGIVSSPDGGPPPYDGVWISARRMVAVHEHVAADLVVGAGAGIPMDVLQARLGQAGQWMPVNPSAHRDALLGQLLATDDADSLQSGYGTPRDNVLGVEIVTGDGRVLRFGGRVVKNVAGYDGVRLATGSHGSLGLITRAFLRVRARAATDLTLTWALPAGVDPAAALVVIRDAAPAEALDLLTPGVLSDPAPAGGNGAWIIAARLQGSAPDVAERRTLLDTAARGAGLQHIGQGAGAPGGETGRGTGTMDTDAWTQLARSRGNSSWQLSGAPGIIRGVSILDRMVRSGAVMSGVMHAGTGRVHAWGSGSPDAALSALAEDNFPTPLWLTGAGRRRQVSGVADPAAAQLIRRLTAVFDPAGILSPRAEQPA